VALDGIEQSAEFQAARSSVGRVCPDLELFRDGRIICGHNCRFTPGRLALLQTAEHPIFAGETDEVEARDIMSAFYYLAERNLDEAVWIADDPERRDRVYARWAGRFGRRDQARICEELVGWFQDMRQSMPDAYDGDDHSPKDRNWPLLMVHLFASEYGWDRDYTLWLLPFPAAVRLQDIIATARGIKDQVSDITDDAITLLEAAEKARESANGEG